MVASCSLPGRASMEMCIRDSTSSSHLTRAFLERAEKEGRVVNVSDDLPRSFVLCTQERGNSTVYLSQLSAATLLRRAESNSFE